MDPGTAGPLDDSQLVARIGGGDQAAIATLHDRFSARIYFIALRELRSRADAEDVRNETLTRVFHAIQAGRLDTPSALSSFVLATARNVMRELQRQNRRAEPIGEQDFAARAASEVDFTVKRAIEAVIRRLKPREQAFLRLYYYDELTKTEISVRLGIPEERLRLIKSRALKNFRQIYHRMVE